ncbi:F0F1 ATP synthase subunit epsilon [Chryseobacterium gotjawalense]|uniref:F0F1 ATP synthase subunit epsilon n=1 Tax=Chryseobacterium gotjawalense TaxID=3042315 RepID=A0ABY8RGJ2_9FLAO|nr:F0F1 ATP synthase subunit epsilon [Chryseobacterium sp. wdc7]WHF52911.1 F0F1 ATP synthase subunit epsilon [Chryseobacterium sp. wdc7]
MNLKILLPYEIFAHIKDVKRMVIETSEGFYGLLPQRLDCVAALVPGILTYTTSDQKDIYVAVDQGILVKAGAEVLVSVHNAFGGTDLGKLSELLKSEFNSQNEIEFENKSVIAKLEVGFVYSFDKFRNQ